MYAGTGGTDGYITPNDITNASEAGMEESGRMYYSISDRDYKTISDPMYAGWRYGTSGSLASNRTNENKSLAYQVVENWYQTNIVNNGQEKYISKTAIYCSDRSIGRENYNVGENYFWYSGLTRIDAGTSNPIGNPTLKCDTLDQFTEGFGLMTSDEMLYAGVRYGRYGSRVYYNNSANSESATGGNWWFTMSPAQWNKWSDYWVSTVVVIPDNSGIIESNPTLTSVIRPVISINGIYSEGDGTSTNPYKVTMP